MKLEEYLFRAKESKKAFTKRLGISESHLYQILRGDRYPSKELAKRIEEATDGKVTRHELLYPNEAKSPFFKDSE